MVVKDQRFGRKNGKGFYDYPASGPRRLWPGISGIVGRTVDPDTISVKDLKDRFLFTAALEAARCMFEEVVTDPREADVGSILGFGYAPYTGGTISFIDGMGLEALRRAGEGACRDLRPALHTSGKADPDVRARRNVLRKLRAGSRRRLRSFHPASNSSRRRRPRAGFFLAPDRSHEASGDTTDNSAQRQGALAF